MKNKKLYVFVFMMLFIVGFNSILISQASSVNIYSTDGPNQSSWLDSPEEDVIRVAVQSKSAAQEKSLTLRAQQLVMQAFDAMDTWIETPLIIPDSIEMNPRGSLNNTLYSPNDLLLKDGTINRSPNLKISVVLKQIDTVFASLETLMNGSSLQPIKDAVLTAVRAFSQESTIQSPILKRIVDSAKTALVAPVKLAVKVTATTIGTGVGAAGNTAVGFGVGLRRAVNRVSDQNHKILEQARENQENVIKTSVKLFATTAVTSLYGIADTAKITAYASAQGAALGAAGGLVAGNKIAGDVVRLDKPKTQRQLKKDAKKRQGFANNDTRESKDLKSNEVVFKNELVKQIVLGESGSDSLQKKILQPYAGSQNKILGIHQSEQLSKLPLVSPQPEIAVINNNDIADTDIWTSGERDADKKSFLQQSSSKQLYQDSPFDDLPVANFSKELINVSSQPTSPRGVADNLSRSTSPALSRSNSSDSLQITNSIQSDFIDLAQPVASPTTNNEPFELSIKLNNGVKPTRGVVYQDPRLALQSNSLSKVVANASANQSDVIDLTQSGQLSKNVSSSGYNKNNLPNSILSNFSDTRDPLSQLILPRSNVDFSQEQYIPGSEILQKQSYLQQIKQYFNKPKPQLVRSNSGHF